LNYPKIHTNGIEIPEHPEFTACNQLTQLSYSASKYESVVYGENETTAFRQLHKSLGRNGIKRQGFLNKDMFSVL
jgi:hypothetical protein